MASTNSSQFFQTPPSVPVTPPSSVKLLPRSPQISSNFLRNEKEFSEEIPTDTNGAIHTYVIFWLFKHSVVVDVLVASDLFNYRHFIFFEYETKCTKMWHQKCLACLTRAPLGYSAERAPLGGGRFCPPCLTPELIGAARRARRRSKALNEKIPMHIKNFL